MVMKNKNLIIGASLAVVILIVMVFIVKPFSPKKPAAKPADVKAKAADVKAKSASAVKAPARKTFSKDMGGLTVRILGAKDRELAVKVRAFRGSDANSGVLMAAFASNRMQELPSGNYDIVVDTVPQKIYKNITVSKDNETVKDLGRPAGSLIIKVLNSKKKEASYPVRILHPKSNFIITTATANRPLEVMAGVYDIEIGVAPKVVEEGVKIEPGKDKILDMGVITGALVVKAVDENKKEARYAVRVKKQEKGDIAATGTTGKPMELLTGTYAIELLSAPAQSKKDIKIAAGEETTVEFEVQARPAAPAVPVLAPKKAPAAPAAAEAKSAPAKK